MGILMTKQQVVGRLCSLVSAVNESVFGWSVASDCFCGSRDSMTVLPIEFKMESEVIDFIEQAVREKIERDMSAENGMTPLEIPEAPVYTGETGIPCDSKETPNEN